MNKGNYNVRRSMFWLVTLMAVTIVGHALLIFVRSGFPHPVRVVRNLLALGAIWSLYLDVVRDLRAAPGEMADNLSIRVETSMGLCCILGYSLAIAAVE